MHAVPWSLYFSQTCFSDQLLLLFLREHFQLANWPCRIYDSTLKQYLVLFSQTLDGFFMEESGVVLQPSPHACTRPVFRQCKGQFEFCCMQVKIEPIQPGRPKFQGGRGQVLEGKHHLK